VLGHTKGAKIYLSAGLEGGGGFCFHLYYWNRDHNLPGMPWVLRVWISCAENISNIGL